jgi:hypothetical protein
MPEPYLRRIISASIAGPKSRSEETPPSNRTR